MPIDAQDLPTPIGRSPHFVAMMASVSLLANLAKPVLVIGERGTGKELIAARLHYLSPRWNQPFVKLNCAALSESLLEAELFGHEAGAFTGASRRRAGRFELAHRGTLFLDEIANAPMSVQETILRVVEYGTFERVGGGETVHVDVRLVAATNVDLPSLAEMGKFRADLLDRLAFDVITIPPLRERPDDISLLADHIALNMTKELKRDFFAGFTEQAMSLLKSHTWPGNVRELRNVIERAVARNPDPDGPVDQIILDPFASPWRPGTSLIAKPACRDTKPSQDAEPSKPDLPPSGYDFSTYLQTFEHDLLKTALIQNNNNQKKTAEFLNLTYHQLRNYLRKHKIIGASE